MKTVETFTWQSSSWPKGYSWDLLYLQKNTFTAPKSKSWGRKIQLYRLKQKDWNATMKIWQGFKTFHTKLYSSSLKPARQGNRTSSTSWDMQTENEQLLSLNCRFRLLVWSYFHMQFMLLAWEVRVLVTMPAVYETS